jgi:hypothetical protein
VVAQQRVAYPHDRLAGRDRFQYGVVIEHGQRGHGRRTIAWGRLVNRRPKLTIVAPNASPEEAAAVVAALERFMRETAPRPAPPRPRPNPWKQAALAEGIRRAPEPPVPWV